MPLSASSAVTPSCSGASATTVPDGSPPMTGAVSSSAGAPTYAIDATGGSAMSAPMKYDGCGGWLYAEFCPATPTRYCESCIRVGMRASVTSVVV